MMRQALGRHVILDLYGCDPEVLEDQARMRQVCLDAVGRSGATILHDYWHKFEPQGLSGVVVIAESHLAVHTYPEFGAVTLDYYTCGERVNPWVTITILKNELNPKYLGSIMEVNRGALAEAIHTGRQSDG